MCKTDHISYTTAVEYLTTIDTPTLSNAIELLATRSRGEGFTPACIRCMFPELGRMCGYAVTAHVETLPQSAPCDGEKFIELYRTVQCSLKPAIIVFQETGARPDMSAHCGEIMATIFKQLGAIGLLTDSCVRDIAEVRALGFHCFARGSVASHGHFRIVRVGDPVQILGLVVQPGDILHGDENGALLIPREKIELVPGKVDLIRRRENDLLNYVRGAEFNLDDLRRWTVE
jgi:regulator of RNase E activity RraA